MAKRTELIAEAVRRLVLMEVEDEAVKRYEEEQEIPCSFVNHAERKIGKTSLTEEQKSIIADLEKDGEQLVYYVITDTGMWLDGAVFERWSFLTISGYQSDWDIEREKSIAEFGCVPSYIYNCEEPDCSERVEMPFQNVDGLIMNKA